MVNRQLVFKSVSNIVSQDSTEKHGIDRLRNAIPDYCFRPSWSMTLAYLCRDLCLLSFFFAVGWWYIPSISYKPLRLLLWPIYGFGQGLVYTGLWEMGHEMGHGALFQSKLPNNCFGFVLHSCLLTPYFAWQSTHAKHHRFTAHMDKDPNHIPARFEGEHHITSVHNARSLPSLLDEWLEDAPLYVLCRLIFQQVFGWPLYLAFSIAAGKSSCDYRKIESTTWMPNWLLKSHYNPVGSNFRPDETLPVLLSDLGLMAVIALLYNFGRLYGFGLTFLLFGQPWMWLNHWIVAVTFLHHTHPDVPKYDAGAWNYVKGATATIDRDFGLIGTFFFHNVVPHHVVHHLFPRIPFYYTPVATEAIRPVLGESYHRDTTPYIYALWREFRSCQWVTSDNVKNPEDRALWFMNSSGRVLSDKSAAQSAVLRTRLATWW